MKRFAAALVLLVLLATAAAASETYLLADMRGPAGTPALYIVGPVACTGQTMPGTRTGTTFNADGSTSTVTFENFRCGALPTEGWYYVQDLRPSPSGATDVPKYLLQGPFATGSCKATDWKAFQWRAGVVLIPSAGTCRALPLDG